MPPTNEPECDPVSTSQTILDGTAVLPQKLYHFGQMKYLAEDIRSNGIPEEAWNEFIMGEENTSHHLPSRRGLYATDGIDTNGFGGGPFGFRNDGMIEIEITAECRDLKRVATLDRLDEDVRFQAIFKKYPPKDFPGGLTEFKKRCLDPGMALEGYLDKKCEPVVAKFLDTSKIGIVHDDQMTKSYYIRDRSCIKGIKGTPDQLLEILSSNPDIWRSPCQRHLTSEYLPSLLVKSLARASAVLTEKQLKALHDGIDKLSGSERWRADLHQLLSKYRQCLEKGRLKEFQTFLSNFPMGLSDGKQFHLDPDRSVSICGD